MTNVRLAARIAIIYCVVGCAWILLSDWVSFSDTSLQDAYWFQTAKGLGYVFATGLLLFWLVFRDARLLSEKEACFRLLIERAPDAVLVQSEGRIVYMNAAALALIGAKSLAQVIGREVMDVIHPSSREVVKERVVRVTTGTSSVMCQEETYMRLDGAPVVCEVSAVPVQFNGKNSALVFIRDATERKCAQEQQSNAQKMAMIRELAGGLAHELNNLVQVINGNAELARASLAADAKEQQHLGQVLHAGKQVSDWVSRMMAFSCTQDANIESLSLKVKEVVAPIMTPSPASTQELLVPLRAAPDVSKPAPAAEPAPASVAKGVEPKGKGTVLLAEDDAMVRNLTERFLSNAGYTVLLARDGVEAVAVFEANAKKLSAVVLDVIMPRMGGFEAYQRISARDANMPVIFASGFSGYGTPANVELIPGVNFLQKPFDRNDLLSAVRRAVESRRSSVFG